MRRTGSIVLALGLAAGVAMGAASQEDDPRDGARRAALDSLSDGEHFGLFIGHLASLSGEMRLITDELAAFERPDDIDAWLVELAGDAEAAGPHLALIERWASLFDAEITWLDGHPPRSCWTDAHEAWRDVSARSATATRDMVHALRAGDGEALVGANADFEAVRAGPFPEIYALGQPCWSGDGEEALDANAGVASELVAERSLEALTDAEHFGVFVGHVVGSLPALEQLQDVPYPVPESEPATSWLAELAADPEGVATYLALLGRLEAMADDELAWLEANPPRPCWKGVHEAYSDWFARLGRVIGEFATAIRTNDAARLGMAYTAMKVLEASPPPDPSAAGPTCWPAGG